VLLIKHLAEPVVPLVETEELPEANLTAFCHHVLLRLRPEHYNVFLYIVAFLREVLKHSDKNHCSPVQLALVFAPVLTKAPVLDKYGQKRAKRPKNERFLIHFLKDAAFCFNHTFCAQ